MGGADRDAGKGEDDHGVGGEDVPADRGVEKEHGAEDGEGEKERSAQQRFVSATVAVAAVLNHLAYFIEFSLDGGVSPATQAGQNCLGGLGAATLHQPDWWVWKVEGEDEETEDRHGNQDKEVVEGDEAGEQDADGVADVHDHKRQGGQHAAIPVDNSDN